MANARTNYTTNYTKVPKEFNGLADVSTHFKNLQRELEKESLNKISKYTQTIGDGSATSFTLKHNLSSYDVAVTAYSLTAPYVDVAISTVERTSESTIEVTFAAAPATDSVKIVVIG